MKKLTLGLLAGLIALTSTAAAALARTPPATASVYRVVELRGLSKFKTLTLVGMNGNGDVVGNAFIGGRSVIVLELEAGTASEQVVIVRAPSGFTSVSASGINGDRLIGAEAWRTNRWSVPYVAEFQSGHFRWVRLLVSKPASYEVDGISATGDIVGTMMTSQGSPGRAVVWSVVGNIDQGLGTFAYGRGRELALSHGYTHSSASSIWGNGSREVIGGVQYKGTLPSDRYTVWSPRPVQSGTIASGFQRAGWLRPPFAIGGRGGQVYAVGRLMGVDTGGGWRSKIRITSTGVQPGPVLGLPLPEYPGAECFYGANGVSATTSGAFLAVGGIACIGTKLQPEALLWRAERVVILQTRIQAGSGWRLGDAAAINATGQIVGTGKLNRRDAVFLLTRR